MFQKMSSMNAINSEIRKLDDASEDFSLQVKQYHLKKAREEINEINKRKEKIKEALKREYFNQGSGEKPVLKDDETCFFNIGRTTEGEIEFIGGILNEKTLRISVNLISDNHQWVWIDVTSEKKITHPLILSNLLVSYKIDSREIHYDIQGLKETNRFQMISENQFRFCLQMNCIQVSVTLLGSHVINSPILFGLSENVREVFSKQTTCENPTFITKSSNQFCLIDTQKDSVQLLNENLDIQTELKFLKPKAALYNDSGDILICHKGAISILNKHMKTQQQILGQYNGLTSNSNAIFTTEEDGNVTKFVKIVKTNDIYQKSFMKNFELKDVKIRYIKVSDGKIFVTDMRNNAVYSFDLSTMQCNKSNFKLNKPAGLEVLNDQVYVCDRDNHKIVTFGIDLRFRHLMYTSCNYLYPNCIIHSDHGFFVVFQHQRGENGAENGILVKLTGL